MIGWLIIRPIGLLLFSAGVITLPTPLPIGAVLMGLGLIVLLSVSRTIARNVVVLRQAHPRFDAMMAMAEQKIAESRLGMRAARILRKTRPGRLPMRSQRARAPFNS